MAVRNFLVLVILSFAAVSGKTIEKGDIVWFPAPSGNGVIPGSLKPLTSYKEADPAAVHFYLYTKANKVDSDELSVENPESINYVDGECVKLLVHGFGAGLRSDFPWKLREEYVKDNADNCNIIIMDWSDLSASPDYFTAVANAQTAKIQAATLLQNLKDAGKLSWDKVHLIGYSLGGQVVGMIGNHIKEANEGEMVARITALDPALPFFDVADEKNRTGKDDAVYVDVIHTAANGLLGYWLPLGHADWYPNGGRYQPGCGIDLTGSCGHGRAPACFTESVFSSIKFEGKKCANIDEVDARTCSGQTAEMGHHTTPTVEGIFYIETNSEAPFVKPITA